MGKLVLEIPFQGKNPDTGWRDVRCAIAVRTKSSGFLINNPDGALYYYMKE
jgi:hypothetical protein